MTAGEMIAHFPAQELDFLGLVFWYLSEHAYEARLRDGSRLQDATDFREFLREMAKEAEFAKSRAMTKVATSQGKRPATKVMCRSVNLTWKCDICRAERPDEKISVHQVDIGPPNLPPGIAMRNVKYCNDSISCKEAAQHWGEKRA